MRRILQLSVMAFGLALMFFALPDKALSATSCGSMQANSAIRCSSGWTWWNPVYKGSPDECRSYCGANNADACEWYGNGDCYVEWGSGCYVEGGFGGWYAATCSASSGDTNGAQYISQSVPTSVTTGQTFSVSVTMRNSGTTTWTSGAGYKLGSQNPQDNGTWSFGRVYLPYDVGPGGSVTFNFSPRAPSSPGNYNFQWRMLREGVMWFGDYTSNVVINVSNPPYPSCSYAGPDGDTVVKDGSARRTYIYGVSGASTVYLPTWSDYGGQDDIVWYSASGYSGSTWYYDIPTSARNGTGGVNVHVYLYNSWYSGVWCDSANFNMISPDPSVSSVSINSGTIVPNGSNQYNITIQGYSPYGGGHISHEYILINYQGANGGNYRGYVTWYWGNAWPGYKDNRACSGAGYAAIQPGYGDSYINLDGCSVSDSGNYRTVTFTVRFNSSFTSPSANNDISGYVCQDTGACAGWTNFETNFNLADPTPSVNNITINGPIVPNASNQYNITVQGYSPYGAGSVSHEYALINYQGENAGNYRGYVTWYWGNAWPGYKDNRACSGGGYAAIQPGYGDGYINMDACSISDSGNYRTVTFTVRFSPSFTSPTTNNDISGYVCNNGTWCAGWTNFQTNFNLAARASCSSAGPDGDTVYTTSGYRRTYAYGVADATVVYFPTWTDYGGQDDIVWYSGSVYSGSTWYADIPLAPRNGTGNTNVHVYVYNSAYGNTWCDSANFNLVYPPPDINSVTISSSTVKPDNSTQYTISIRSTSSYGASYVYNQYALINYQGGNAGNYRGYLQWYPSNIFSGYKDNQACSGGGYAGIYPGYGDGYLNMVSCSMSDSGNSRTINFNVRFNSSFTSPTTNNDISGYTCDPWRCNGWINFETNFNVALRPSCSYAGPDGDVTQATTGTRRAYAYGVANASAVYFPTWASPGGQDDIVWYSGTNAGSGTWYADANLASHPGVGTVYVDVYVYEANYGNVWCDNASFTRWPPNGTININSNIPSSWTLTGPYGTYSGGPNESSRSYSVPYGVYSVTPGNLSGYDMTVTPSQQLGP